MRMHGYKYCVGNKIIEFLPDGLICNCEAQPNYIFFIFTLKCLNEFVLEQWSGREKKPLIAISTSEKFVGIKSNEQNNMVINRE